MAPHIFERIANFRTLLVLCPKDGRGRSILFALLFLIMAQPSHALTCKGLFDNPYNPQIAIWELQEKGQVQEAVALLSHYKNLLETGPITNRTESPQFGNTKDETKFIYFEDGTKAVMKIGRKSLDEDPTSEVAVYLIDRYLNLNIVPLTVLRSIDGKTASLQLFIHNGQQNYHWEHRANKKTEWFEQFILNWDRNWSNMIFMRDGRKVLIDSARAGVPSFLEGKFEASIYKIRSVVDAEYGNSFMKEIDSLITRDKFTEAHVKLAVLKNITYFLPTKKVFEKIQSTTEAEWRVLLSPVWPQEKLDAFLKYLPEFIEDVHWIKSEIAKVYIKLWLSNGKIKDQSEVSLKDLESQIYDEMFPASEFAILLGNKYEWNGDLDIGLGK